MKMSRRDNMEDKKVILEVKDLKKYFPLGKGKKAKTYVKAVDGVSFKLNEGETLGLVGESGCGKSTLLHLLGGVDNATNGDVFINGENITKMKKSQPAIFRRKHIGLIYQFYNLIPVLDVKENITLPLKLDHQKVDEEQLNKIIEMLNLQDRITHLPSQLSGGQQQRVAIARAIITSPDLILADEPTGNLDRKSSEEVITYLNKLHEKGQTIILVTHDLNIAKQASRIITMEDGKIIKDEKV